MLKIKRAYEAKEDNDGKRVLIDRLWPRGLTKSEADIDEWMKEIAPSTRLRKWFSHDPEKWDEFREKYLKELSSPENTKLLENIVQNARHSNITLIYSARDFEHSHVRVLKELVVNLLSNFDGR